jgi:pyruvate/2-oxoglutarate dehydrogenase complex dihydrolipoamide acyltransferase (E2) component
MPTKWWCRVTTSIIMPDLGVGPVSLSVWFVEPGDSVLQGERVLEVLAAGATFDITAPATGRLLHKEAFSREFLTPGQVLGVIEGE